MPARAFGAATTATAVTAAMAARSIVFVALLKAEPTLQERLSGTFGSVSLIAWICLLLPQLIQNYKLQSAEGLSMAFLFVWLLGDIANLSGALLTSLNPAAIVLASYFCIADIVLVSQCLYYNAKTVRLDRQLRHARSRRRSSSTAVASTAVHGASAEGTDNDVSDNVSDDVSDDSPLLAPRRRSSSIGLPGSHVRHHSSRHRSPSNIAPLRRILTGEDEIPDGRPWLNNVLSLLAVWTVGTLCYWFTTRLGAWDVDSPPADPAGDDGSGGLDFVSADLSGAVIGMGLGYFSAVCYLCARVPQIVKNYREKSCEGLSLLFFLLSLTGNFTYGGSLIAASQDRAYLLKALPWLLGSLGTMVEDIIIFFQFRLYAPPNTPKVRAPANGSGTTSDSASSDTIGVYGAA